jgi:hypothetical protein
LKAGAMKQDGFEHVTQVGLSTGGDLHFPNMKAEWFEQQALPFLDQFSSELKKPTTEPSVASGEGAATTQATQPSESEAGPSKAQSLLSVAQILIANNETELAKKKLQAIISAYPTDPAAAKAKELLGRLNAQ